MKKYLTILLITLFVLSCSTLSLLGHYNIPNDKVKRAIATKVDGSQDFVVVKGSTKVKEVYVENGKLQVIIDIETSNILSAIFTSSSSTKITLRVESGIKYADGKLYAKDIRIKDLNGVMGEEQIKQISNAIIYTLLDNKEIYDFSKENISVESIEDVYIGENNIVVDFK